MIGFVNLVFLGALVAVGLPVVIHFLTRARPRVVRFPAFHLLMEAGAGRQSLHRLRTLLILSLRTLLVAAVVLMFAQPFLRSSVAQPGEAGSQRRVVLVVDASMSMRAGQGAVSLFAAARGQAADVLRSLEPGSLAGIIYIGARPEPALPALSQNLAALHDTLSIREATLERGDPAAALAEAQRMLEGDGEIFVFSDFQRTNWSDVDFAKYKDVKIFLRRVVEQPVDNVGLVSLERSPAEPIAGETIELTATVFNSTPHGRQEQVHLDLQGVTQTQEVALQPYSSGTATFSFVLPRTGIAPGRIDLEPDDLNDDNTRYFSIRVREALSVLVISDNDPNDSHTPAFYASKALSPSDRAGTGIRIIRRISADVDRGTLETVDLFCLVPPVRLSEEMAQVIARRVSDGAQLLCFLDGPTAPSLVSSLRSASEAALSPPFELVRPVASGDTLESFAKLETLAGPLRAFRSADRSDLLDLRFARRYLTQNIPTRKDEVLIRYGDDSAALTLSPVGRGMAVFANMPIMPDGSNVAGSPLFPSLLHEMLRALRRGGDEADNAPGEPWTLDVITARDDAEATFTMQSPDDEAVPVTVVSRGRATKLAIDAVRLPGHYAVHIEGERADAAIGVVNVDAMETDTRQIDVLEVAGDGGAAAMVAVVNDEGELLSAGLPTNLWHHLAAVAALLLLAEMAILAFWRRTPKRANPGRPGR